MLAATSDLSQTFQHRIVDHAPAALVLTLFVSAIAYIHSPRLKALVYTLPIPFACAYLTTGRAIDATNMAGLALIIAYCWLVYFLAARLGMPLVLSIIAGVAMYVTGGLLSAYIINWPVPLAGLIFLAVWAFVLRFYRARLEPGHRSSIPWWINAPIVFVVCLILFNATDTLSGTVFTFPYAGIFTSYEMRHSLRTLAGQFTINAISIWVLILTMWAVQTHVHWPWPLAIGVVGSTCTVALAYRLGLGRPPAES